MSHSASRAGRLAWLAIVALISLSGCGGAKSDPSPTDETDHFPVRVLVLDDAPLAEAIQSTWAARGEGPIEVLSATSSERVLGRRRLLQADVVVYPSGLLGELAEKDLIVPLTAEARRDPNLAINDIHELLRLRELSWNRAIYASPLGAPQLFLLYRRDLLEELGAEPPDTWAEYAQLAKKLQELPSDADRWDGACEPGGDGWLGQMLLARAAPYGIKSNRISSLWTLGTMEPRIATPPFQRALRDMGEAPVNRLPTPQDCFRALVTGHCGMAVCWPSAAALKDVQRPPNVLPLGCAQLPGARQFYDDDSDRWQDVDKPVRVPLLGSSGRLVSVTKEARRRLSAAHRLVWLTGKEWNADIGPASSSTMACRKSQMAALTNWTSDALDQEARRQFAAAVELSEQRMPSITSIRLPGRHLYLQALDAGSQQALNGEATAADALQGVARIWREITEQLGVEKQSDAYARHLDL